MKQFMDKDFLLSSPTACTLFHDCAEKLPIIDYHCHINPEEIARDRHYENITQLWLGGDHYKWRFMRACGIDEFYITGAASDKDKFFKWASALGHAIGNPLYQWSHLELQRYFGYYGNLNANTAEEVWNLCNQKLSDSAMGVRGLILQSNVTHICTTDDPIDSLCWHQAIAEDSSFPVQVLPAWRPDSAMNIEKDDFMEYVNKLSSLCGISITCMNDLKAALTKRLDFFASMGCHIADHGLDFVMNVPASEDEINQIFKKRLAGEAVSRQEELAYKTEFMKFSAGEYCRLGWVMQLHYGCKRNNNTVMLQKLGPDTGFDCINDYTPSAQLADFLDMLIINDCLPKTILYSLNPNDNAIINTVIGCFQDSSAVGKLQQGSAWWFNDHFSGIKNQLLTCASLGNLSGFIGMLTDSRSFLSYTRHEYFRRILCDILGDMVENGEFPNDFDTLSEIVKNISYHNAAKYFNF